MIKQLTLFLGLMATQVCFSLPVLGDKNVVVGSNDHGRLIQYSKNPNFAKQIFLPSTELFVTKDKVFVEVEDVVDSVDLIRVWDCYGKCIFYDTFYKAISFNVIDNGLKGLLRIVYNKNGWIGLKLIPLNNVPLSKIGNDFFVDKEPQSPTKPVCDKDSYGDDEGDDYENDCGYSIFLS